MSERTTPKAIHGLTLIEVTMALGLLGVFGIAVYSMLNIGMILGAKNTAVNTAHQQARTAMLQMIQDLHSAVSLPALSDVNHVPLVNPAPNTAAPGISFQLWSTGPYQGFCRLRGWLVDHRNPSAQRITGTRHWTKNSRPRPPHRGRHYLGYGSWRRAYRLALADPLSQWHSRHRSSDLL